MELLKGLSPKARNIGVLYDGAVREVVKGMQTHATALNVQLLPFEVNGDYSFAEALGNECCVAAGDSGREAYTAIAWGVGLSHERSDVAGAAD